MEFTTVKIDRDTHARLQELAGEETVAGYLRRISKRDDDVKTKIDFIAKDVSELKSIFTMSRKDKDGQMVPVASMNEIDGTPIPWLAAAVIQDELEKNPYVRRAGWYNRTKDGWKFDQRRFNRWAKQNDEDKEALEVALEAMDNNAGVFLRKDKPSNTDEWMMETAEARQKLIEYGKRIIARRNKEQ